MLARRAIRRSRRDEAARRPAPRADTRERGGVDERHRRHPARRPEVVPVARVRLEVEAGAEQADVQQHARSQPSRRPRRGCARSALARHPIASGWLASRSTLAEYSGAHPPIGQPLAMPSASPEAQPDGSSRLFPGRGSGDCRGESPTEPTPFPFRPAPGERTPPLVSPPIPRARRLLSGAGRLFSASTRWPFRPIGDNRADEHAGAGPRQPPPRRRRRRAEGGGASCASGWSGAPGVDVEEEEAGGLRLMERMTGYDRAVLVDAAVTGGDPGRRSAAWPPTTCRPSAPPSPTASTCPARWPSAGSSATRCRPRCASSRSRPRACWSSGTR